MTDIPRFPYALLWGDWNAALETGGFLVGDDVSITLDLQFVKKA